MRTYHEKDQVAPRDEYNEPEYIVYRNTCPCELEYGKACWDCGGIGFFHTKEGNDEYLGERSYW